MYNCNRFLSNGCFFSGPNTSKHHLINWFNSLDFLCLWIHMTSVIRKFLYFLSICVYLFVFHHRLKQMDLLAMNCAGLIGGCANFYLLFSFFVAFRCPNLLLNSFYFTPFIIASKFPITSSVSFQFAIARLDHMNEPIKFFLFIYRVCDIDCLRWHYQIIANGFWIVIFNDVDVHCYLSILVYSVEFIMKTSFT